MANLITVLLHWNLDYAEFPRSEAENIISKSYQPMIDAIQSANLGPILMNITGHTVEYLQKHNHELLDQIKLLLDENKIELVGSGYSHPILPLLPKRRRLGQLRSHKDQLESLFDINLKGIWPPELAVSQLVLDDVHEVGYEWSVTDHEHLSIAQSHFNDQEPFTKRPKTITEILVEAYWAKGVQIPFRYYRGYRVANHLISKYSDPLIRIQNLGKSHRLVQASVVWTNITVFALQQVRPFYTTNRLQKMIKKSPLQLLPLYMSDIEFFGYRSHIQKSPAPSSFVKFLSRLADQNIKLASPSNHHDFFVDSDYQATTGSWSPDKSLRIWTDSEDNRELTRRLQEIYAKLENRDKEVIKLLRIAENSDARGWSPINERKSEAFAAIEQLNRILGI